MLKRVVMLVGLMTVDLAWAAPDLVKMAAEQDNFPAEFVDALGQYSGEEISRLTDPRGRTVLHLLAARSHQAGGLAALLAGVDVNARDIQGRTAIFDVLEAHDPNFKGEADLMFLEMLVARGANVNVIASDGSTPLAVALQKGDFRKAEFLIQHGAVISSGDAPAVRASSASTVAKRDESPKDPLAVAMESVRQAVLPGAVILPTAEQLSAALTAVDFHAILGFLRAGWKIDEQDEKGQTALFRAVEAIRPDLVSLLIFEGANPNLANKAGQTPLMASLRILGITGQRMTALLLLKGADVHAVAQDGTTPLTVAAAAGHDFGVLWLVAAGGDPRASTAKGSLMEYATHGPTMYLLKHFGVAPKTEKPPETNPQALLIAAIRKGDKAEVERQLANGAAADSLDKKNGNALTNAAYFGQFEIVDLLIQHGASINEQYEVSGWHVFHSLAGWGMSQGDSKVAAQHIENLLKRGANPNIQAKDGTTPLMIAAKQGNKDENTEALLKGGAKLDLRNTDGLTALGVAKKYGRTEMVEFLKERGATE